ncbi:MAG: tRNA uridine-5-carboxymethylaminomethyl(34) synthesis GTPase MnmE [Peptostreptococcales bacterium]
MEDTIVALATAPGEAGIGIIRISGSQAFDILKRIFLPQYIPIDEMENRKLTYGHIVDQQKRMIDEVLSVMMQAPHTYTREDIVEIHCHGGMVPIRRILEIILSQGARISEPGEFTKRAFLNGRIDLSQAEAIMDMVSAKTDKGFDVAIGNLEGGLSEKIRQLRKELLEILAHVIVNIDYPDEDIEEITYETLEKNVTNFISKIGDLIDSSVTGRIIKDGLITVIIGKPNVGKSSLLNLLLNENRAIVSGIPGTTRDSIEEFINIEGIPLRIIDTAGLRHTEDEVEKIGVEKTKILFNKADLIVYMVDGSEKLTQDDYDIMQLLQDKKAIVIINKTDLKQEIEEIEINELLPDKKTISVSAKEGIGINDIKTTIYNMVFAGEVQHENPFIITNVRHKDILIKTKGFLQDAHNMIQLKEALDFIEVDLRSAWESLGEIIGETIAENILDEIFSKFCLGK